MHGTHRTVERLHDAVNHLIAGILPFAMIGRDLPASLDPANPKMIPIDIDDRTLRRAWNALEFATANAPDPLAPLPMLFDDQTRAVLRSYGLDRVDLAAQVYYLAQIVAAQTHQLQREKESGAT